MSKMILCVDKKILFSNQLYSFFLAIHPLSQDGKGHGFFKDPALSGWMSWMPVFGSHRLGKGTSA